MSTRSSLPSFSGFPRSLAFPLIAVASLYLVFSGRNSSLWKLMTRNWLTARLGLGGPTRRFLENDDEADVIRDNTSYFTVRNVRSLTANNKSNTRPLRIRYVLVKHKLGRKVPLIVMIHGSGGQLAQFTDQISHLSQTCHVLAIDLLGHGKSDISYNSQDYTTEALVSHIAPLIAHCRDLLSRMEPDFSTPSSSQAPSRSNSFMGHSRRASLAESDSSDTEPLPIEAIPVVVVAHSYGTTLSVFLGRQIPLAGLVLVSPSSELNSNSEKIKKFLRIPLWLLPLLRIKDRWGGTHSNSVNRYVAACASELVRSRQLRYNKSVSGFVAQSLMRGRKTPTKQDWESIECPVLLIGGKEDTLTPVQEMNVIEQWINGTASSSDGLEISNASKSRANGKSLCLPPCIIENAAHSVMMEQPVFVNAFISKFLLEHAGLDTASLQYQIMETQRQTGDKWSLKNFTKWMATPSVSGPVGNTRFRPMKVMRQTDGEHSPSELKRRYPEIGLIIDISKDTPPYDTNEFELFDPDMPFMTPTSAIPSAQNSFDATQPYQLVSKMYYIKLSTTSKIPPTESQVEQFIQTCNAFWTRFPSHHIGVHCHYGFNRTGFMICSYLSSELGVEISDAIAQFKRTRPPGVRHAHFVDQLLVRSVGQRLKWGQAINTS